jgi:hypothetical protein
MASDTAAARIGGTESAVADSAGTVATVAAVQGGAEKVEKQKVVVGLFDDVLAVVVATFCMAQEAEDLFDDALVVLVVAITACTSQEDAAHDDSAKTARNAHHAADLLPRGLGVVAVELKHEGDPKDGEEAQNVCHNEDRVGGPGMQSRCGTRGHSYTHDWGVEERNRRRWRVREAYTVRWRGHWGVKDVRCRRSRVAAAW